MGVLKCFCDMQMLDSDFSSSDTFEGKRSITNYTETEDYPICQTYISDISSANDSWLLNVSYHCDNQLHTENDNDRYDKMDW